MKNRLAYLLFVLMLFLFGMTSSAAGKSSPAGKKTHKIIWEDPQRITKGGYPRVHRLNDGRLMMSYAKSASNYFRFSEDNGVTWSEEEYKVMPHSRLYVLLYIFFSALESVLGVPLRIFCVQQCRLLYSFRDIAFGRHAFFHDAFSDTD